MNQRGAVGVNARFRCHGNDLLEGRDNYTRDWSGGNYLKSCMDVISFQAFYYSQFYGQYSVQISMYDGWLIKSLLLWLTKNIESLPSYRHTKTGPWLNISVVLVQNVKGHLSCHSESSKWRVLECPFPPAILLVRAIGSTKIRVQKY